MPTQTEQQEQEFPTPPSREELNPAPPPPQATTAQQPQQDKGGVSLLSIEGLVVLMWAMLLDLAGIVLNIFLPGIGSITILPGIITVGIWAYFRRGEMSFKKFLLKRGGILTVLEVLTAGSFPGWSILVLLTVKK